jgi:hypothetical protein
MGTSIAIPTSLADDYWMMSRKVYEMWFSITLYGMKQCEACGSPTLWRTMNGTFPIPEKPLNKWLASSLVSLPLCQ